MPEDRETAMADKMREDFEHYVVTKTLMSLEKYASGDYKYSSTQQSWEAWQAAKSAPDEEAITCDTCGAVTDNPWHSSRGTNRHYHECDKCREQAAKPVPVVGKPVAWGVASEYDGSIWIVAESPQEAERIASDLGDTPIPLYSAPPATEAELEALRKDADKWRDLCSRVGADPSGTISYAGPLEGAPEDWAAIAQEKGE